MQLLPGFSKPKAPKQQVVQPPPPPPPTPPPPPPPEPPPPPPTPADPSVEAARNAERQAALRRKGRRSTILTGGEGVLGETSTDRPAARAAELLGQ